MIVVDASVWISVLVPADSRHGASRRWFNRWHLGNRQIVVPILFPVEVAGAVSRRMGSTVDGHVVAADILRDPLLQLVVIDESLGETAADLAIDLGLRGADATYVAVAQRFDVPLLTWDHEQATRACVVVPVQAPDEAQAIGSED